MLNGFKKLGPFRGVVLSLESATRPARHSLEARFVVRLLVRTIKEMSADDATHMAAGVSYYALFSLFPLFLFLIAALSLVLETDDIRLRLIDAFSGYFPGSGQLINANLEAVLKVRGALGVFGVLGLLWSGSAIFGGVSRAVNRAWDVHVDRPFFISKPRQLAMALGVGLLFFVSLGVGALARAAGSFSGVDAEGNTSMLAWLAPAILQVSSVLLTTAMFLLMYKFMPNTRTYWRYIWPGAATAAVLFELAKYLFVLYLGRFANFENVYGALTPVIVLSLWTYVSGLILIFGAELSSEYGRLRRGLARGVLLHPVQDPAENRE
jgi:membrane protein